MAAWIETHWYLLAVLLAAGAGALCMWLLYRRAPTGKPLSLLSYLLVWPLIFDSERKAKTKTSGRFVVAGVVVMLLLIAVGLVINPGRGK